MTPPSPPRDQHRGDVRHALVFHLTHRDPSDGDTYEPGLPHLTRELAQSCGVLFGRDGELGKQGGDGGVVPQEVREEALAVAHTDARDGVGARDGEPVVNGSDVGDGVADVDYDAGGRACGVELSHGTVEDAECGDVEALEEYLSYAFVGFARGACEEGEQDGRLVLYAPELEPCEEDVFPVVWVDVFISTSDTGSRTYHRASACIKSVISPLEKGHETTISCPAASASSSWGPTR
jgi:hypothetical protein